MTSSGEMGERGLTGESGPLAYPESTEIQGVYVEDENGELTWVEGYDLVWDNNSVSREVTVDYRDLKQNQEEIAAFKRITKEIADSLSLNQSKLLVHRSTFSHMDFERQQISDAQQVSDAIGKLDILETLYERALRL